MNAGDQGTVRSGENPAWTSTTSLALGYLGLIAWLLPALGLPITIAGLIFGRIGLQSTNVGKARTGVRLAAIALILTIANGLAGGIAAALL